MNDDPKSPDDLLDSDAVRDAARPEGTEEAPADSPETVTAAPAPSAIPKRIGQYHIKRAIASGGMGTVYEATQERPRRTVALKLMKHGIASRSALRRFEYESQILARLRHPGIAQVYDAGTHRDPGAPGATVPFFAMEYIVGAKPITQYARERKLGTRQRMELFAQVCDAIHHGHQKGIIHRDLKPSNILVDAQGQVKIIDFGVARSTDSDMAVTTLQTDIGQLIGTLQYMSPEQCEADPHNIDTRSDVYALGIVFYELLCGRLPYNVTRMAMHEATRIIREEQPTKLSTLNKTLRGDAETIALKALEKDRERRYQSATDFAQDIRRYLNGEAITARPPSILYQLRVFSRRNKALFGAVAAVFVVLVCATIVSTAQYFRAEQARQDAVVARDVARQQRDRAITAERRAGEEAQRALTEAGKSEQIATFMKDMLEGVGPSVALGRDTTMLREILDQTAERVGTDLTIQPEVEAEIRSTIGQTYADLGLLDSAGVHLETAEGIATRELGEEDRQTLLVRSRLADLRRLEGDLPAVEELARKTLTLQRRVLGEEHPDTLASLRTLAEVRAQRGHFEEAETLYHQAIEIPRRVLGDEHRDTLKAMQGLADVLRTQGKYPEAEPLFRQVLAARREVLGDNHPDTLAAMHSLAIVLRAGGREEEAEALNRQTFQIRRRVLGEHHPATLESMNNLALGLRIQGKNAEAETLFRQIIEAKRRVLGDDNPSTLVSKYGLVATLRAQGKSEEVRSWVAQIIAHLKRAADEPDAGPVALNHYAWELLTCKPVDLRDPVTALAAAKKAVEASDPPNFGVLDTLALAYQMTGDLDKAIETQRRAVALLPTGKSSMRTVLETRLGELLVEKGSFAEAEQLLLGSYRQIEGRPGVKPKRVCEALERLINLYDAWGKPDEGGKYRGALAEQEAAGPTEPETKDKP